MGYRGHEESTDFDMHHHPSRLRPVDAGGRRLVVSSVCVCACRAQCVGALSRVVMGNGVKISHTMPFLLRRALRSSRNGMS